ncbi:hypothetical protein [Rhizobium grahamii]|uniref:Uncharacterized protein n=1 Tax=Rhizobium grahamii TaxID=1120045 RepID=A0A370KG25_9HYPH|nr:hypothetical protein [Rhizobium grahamii]RDJ03591.1 hypothetical protein B5K06_29820 [Rhizobium grahamii]
MRSPWKLITGIVSRGKPGSSNEVEDKIRALPDPGSGEAALAPPVIEASPYPADEIPLGPSAAPANGLARLASFAEIKPISGTALTDGVEPVLATTIRLVTKDRLSVRAELSASTAAPNAFETHAPDISLVANLDRARRLTEPTTLLENDSRIGNPAVGRGEPTHIERTGTPTPTQVSTVAKGRVRRVKRRDTREAAKVLPEQGFIAETVRLDSEINELRHQLSQKLRVQNEQLRRMLARFDSY